MKIKRTRQCAKCPWKKSTNPHEIPDGYSVERHQLLSDTIAEPGALHTSPRLKVMGCHEHATHEQVHCVGWLNHQLGPGNNLALRLAVLGQRFQLKLDGPQHERFEDTIP